MMGERRGPAYRRPQCCRLVWGIAAAVLLASSLLAQSEAGACGAQPLGESRVAAIEVQAMHARKHPRAKTKPPTS